jgi:hypothetical protein
MATAAIKQSVEAIPVSSKNEFKTPHFDRVPRSIRREQEQQQPVRPMTGRSSAVCAASLREVVIKRGLGRRDFKVDARVLPAAGKSSLKA